jgi:hypothetical protein
LSQDNPTMMTMTNGVITTGLASATIIRECMILGTGDRRFGIRTPRTSIMDSDTVTATDIRTITMGPCTHTTTTGLTPAIRTLSTPGAIRHESRAIDGQEQAVRAALTMVAVRPLEPR